MENNNLIRTIDNEMSPRFGHTLTLVCKTKGHAKAVLFGGATGADGHFSINSDTYIYYIEQQKWIKLNRNNIFYNN
jgi:protein phosphatase